MFLDRFQFRSRLYLLQSSNDEHGKNGQHSSVHGHGHRHFVERNAVKENLISDEKWCQRTVVWVSIKKIDYLVGNTVPSYPPPSQ